MKSTDNFKKVIQNYLQNRASSDTLFAVSFAKTNKNIDDCITYILNTVHKSGCSGFEDNEIFSMAVHYYDEGEFEVGGKIGCSVVTNHKAELTPEEIEEAKSEAKQKIIDDECARLREKQVKVSTVNIDKIEPCLQVSLF